MNLKNLSLVVVILLTASACREKEPDNKFLDQLWSKTVQVSGLKAKTRKPHIAMMDEDLYHRILRTTCEFESKTAKPNCLIERKRLEALVPIKTGKKYSEVYDRYLRSDRRVLQESCGKLDTENKRWLCAKLKTLKPIGVKTLGNTYLRNHYIEIYREDIWSCVDYLPITNAERESFFYSVVAHEMLHAALHLKKISPLDHHRLMRDRYIGPMLDFISDYKKTDRNGYHRQTTFDSLELGIAIDEKWKLDNQPKIPKKPK